MPTPNSAKKIERVQRAGAKRSAGAPRPIGFPLAVMAIVLVGALAVFFARQSRIDAQNEQPQENAAWRVAFGIFHCDAWASPPSNAEDQATTTGIQWGSGYISVSPSGPESSGDKATFGKFLDRVGIKISENGDGPVATVPDGILSSGNTLESGSDCVITDGKDEGQTKKSELVLLRWPPKSNEKTKPQVIRDGFEDVRFTEDREIFALALLPTDVKDDEYPFPDASVTAMNAMTATTTTAPDGQPLPTEAGTTTVPVDENGVEASQPTSPEPPQDEVVGTIPLPGVTTTTAGG